MRSALIAFAAPLALGGVWPDPIPDVVSGVAAVGLGDIDQDGFGDLLVRDADGTARVCYGSAHGVSPATCQPLAAPWPVRALAGVGDVNGDGVPDWAIGNPEADPTGADRGAVRVWLGPLPRGASGATTPFVTPRGDPGARLGEALAPAGDVDGDGRADLLVAGDGAVWLYLAGRDTPQWWDDAPGALDAFGSAGDTDGDGLGDVFVARDGVVRIYRGGPSLAGQARAADEASPVDGAAAGVGDARGAGAARVESWPGALRLVAVGDLNGDGYADAAARTATGVELLLGGVAGLRSVASVPGAADDVAAAGDVDGDGFADVIVAQRGHVNVVHGRGTGPSTSPTERSYVARVAGRPSAQAGGIWLAGVGDLDGNGCDDLGIAHPSGFPDRGRVELVMFGPDPAPNGAQDGKDHERLSRVVGVGDLNGDGHADWVTAAPGYGEGGAPEAGKLTIFARDVATSTVIGDAPGGHLGVAIAAAGDVNGDGLGDLIVGAPDATPPYLVVLAGDPAGLRPLARVTLDDRAPGALGAVIGGGDLDGDGFGDLAFGDVATGWVQIRYLGPTGLAPVVPGVVSRLPIVPGDPRVRGGQALGVLAPGASGWRSHVLAGGSACGSLAGSGGAFAGQARCWMRLEDWETGDDPASVRSTRYGGVDLDATRGCFGWAVSTAGDVDGDGSPDLVVSAPLADVAGLAGAGATWLYRGQGDECPLTTPFWTMAGTEEGALWGSAVAAVGDLDGDGFGDLAVAAERFTTLDGTQDGAVFVLYGNRRFGGAAWPTFIRPWRVVGDGVPVPPGGLTGAPGDAVPGASPDPRESFYVRGLGRSPFGPGWVRLEVEVKPWKVPFDGVISAWGEWRWAGAAGAPLEVRVAALAPGTGYRWRARIAYRSSGAPAQAAGHWTSGGHPMFPAAAHLRTLADAPPVVPARRLRATEVGVTVLVRELLEPTGGGDVTPDTPVTDADDLVAELTVTVSRPAHGSAEIAAGRFSYRPSEPGYIGRDRLTYEVCDQYAQCASAPIDIDVTSSRCPNVGADACARGDFLVVVEMEDGRLASAHCFITAEGEVDCQRNAAGELELGGPACGADG